MKRPTDNELKTMREQMKVEVRRIAPNVHRLMTMLDHKLALPGGERVPTVDEIVKVFDHDIDLLNGYSQGIQGPFYVGFEYTDYEQRGPSDPDNPNEDLAPPDDPEIGGRLYWQVHYSPPGCHASRSYSFLSNEAERYYFRDEPRKTDDQYHLLFPYEGHDSHGYAYPCNIAGKIDSDFVGPLLLALLRGEANGRKVQKPRLVASFEYDEEYAPEWNAIWEDRTRNDNDAMAGQSLYEEYKEKDILYTPDGDHFNAPMAEYGRQVNDHRHRRQLEIAKAHKGLSAFNPEFGVLKFTLTSELEQELADEQASETAVAEAAPKFEDSDIPF